MKRKLIISFQWSGVQNKRICVKQFDKSLQYLGLFQKLSGGGGGSSNSFVLRGEGVWFIDGFIVLGGYFDPLISGTSTDLSWGWGSDTSRDTVVLGVGGWKKCSLPPPHKDNFWNIPLVESRALPLCVHVIFSVLKKKIPQLGYATNLQKKTPHVAYSTREPVTLHIDLPQAVEWWSHPELKYCRYQKGRKQANGKSAWNYGRKKRLPFSHKNVLDQ